MKSSLNRFSTLNRRAEYLKLKTEKEKEKKQEENEEEELEEEEDEQEDKSKHNMQKPKNIPISKTPLSQKTSTNRVDKQKITPTSTTSQIPYNFTRSRINYTSNNNIDLNNRNPKDVLLMRHGLQDKKLQIVGTNDTKNLLNKPGQNPTYSIKQSPNSPKSIKTSSIVQNNPPQILKATNSQSNLNSQKISILGNKYSSLKRFGNTYNKEDDNKNEIKIINKNNNYTINVTNNNNNITVNNNNISNNNYIDMNNKKEEEINIEFNKEEEREIKEESKKDTKSISRKEPRKDKKEKNFTANKDFEKKEEKNNLDNIKTNNEEEEIINNEEEEIEEEMNLTNKKEQLEKKEENIKDNKKREYVSNEQMIENGIEIVEFTEEETNKVLEQKEKNKEKKKLKKQNAEKYKNKKNNKNIDNNKRENFKFHKRGANNFVKRGHHYNRSDYNNYNEDIFEDNYYNGEYDNHKRDFYRTGYNKFYERGRPNPIYRGNRGRGRYRY